MGDIIYFIFLLSFFQSSSSIFLLFCFFIHAPVMDRRHYTDSSPLLFLSFCFSFNSLFILLVFLLLENSDWLLFCFLKTRLVPLLFVPLFVESLQLLCSFLVLLSFCCPGSSINTQKCHV